MATDVPGERAAVDVEAGASLVTGDHLHSAAAIEVCDIVGASRMQATERRNGSQSHAARQVPSHHPDLSSGVAPRVLLRANRISLS